ncbi:MAG: hypothetical protein ACK4L7_05130, partial [Flavobacteriales bacterium]
MRWKPIGVVAALIAAVVACRRDSTEPLAPAPPGSEDEGVSVDLGQVPYPTLSQYRFFRGPLAAQQPNAGVLPYDVITPLFSDYAHKFRFVWMPPGTRAVYAGDAVPLDFPDGA